MKTDRLEAFSDGVFAIIITITVLDLKVPHATNLAALRDTLPTFLSYALSFVYVGIYWNNHHHLLHAARSINGKVMWANLHLLFWLSLAPFTTEWLGNGYRASAPVAVYGVMLLCAGIAYTMLTRALIMHHGAQSELAAAIGEDYKGIASLVIYAVAIPLAFKWPIAAEACYWAVAVMWMVPDQRIEQALRETPG